MSTTASKTVAEIRVGDQVRHIDDLNPSYYGPYGRVIRVNKNTLRIMRMEGTDYEEPITEATKNFFRYEHQFRSHVAKKDDCPSFIKDYIQEMEECLDQLIGENAELMRRDLDQMVKSGGALMMGARHDKWIAAVTRFEIRIDAAEDLYYDHKYGYAKGRGRKRGYVLG